MTTTTAGNLTLCRNGELLAKRPVLAHWKEGWIQCPYCQIGQVPKNNRCYQCGGEWLEVARGS